MKFRYLLKHGILLAVLLSLFMGLSPAPANAAKPIACRGYYTVQGSDTLGLIAQTYNVRVVDLVVANKLYDPIWIYVAQSLCIPLNAKKFNGEVPTYAKRLPGDFSVSRVGDYVKIITKNFPRKSAYWVKMADATTPRLYEKTGMLKTLNKPTAIGKFKIPKNLRQTQVIQVCLKNNYTNVNICRNLIKP